MNRVVADLHLHSKYSRAVSPRMNVSEIERWSEKKGLNLVGTADWTHPLWLRELEAGLEEAGKGVYKLKAQSSKLKATTQNSKLKETKNQVNFVLSTEISSIYSQGGKLRRIHNLVIVPSFAVVHKINSELKRRGCKLMSDGRPIIGLSSIELCELVWGIDKKCLIVPAHIWTPYFSMFGSKSGFDFVKECYGEFADQIYAVETGLSSDCQMNWRIKELENRSIVSFSDAHSPEKLLREATVFQRKRKTQNSNVKTTTQNSKLFSFDDLVGAIKRDKNCQWEIAYTVEFHPEEGKYHYTGHRNCGVSHSPEDTKKKGRICPVCGRLLTVGVMHRVEELSNGQIVKLLKKKNETGLVGYYNADDPKRPPYVMLVPLMEILAESFGIMVTSQKVKSEYENLIENLGSEFAILTRRKYEDILRVAGERVAETIKKVRTGDIFIKPGFDGQFGVVKIWEEEEKEEEKKEQMSLF